MSRGNRQTAEFNFHESLFPKIPRYQFKVWGIGGALGEEEGTGRIGKRKKKEEENVPSPCLQPTSGILTILKGINLSFGILRVALPDPGGIPMHSNELQTGYRRWRETVPLRRGWEQRDETERNEIEKEIFIYSFANVLVERKLFQDGRNNL